MKNTLRYADLAVRQGRQHALTVAAFCEDAEEFELLMARSLLRWAAAGHLDSRWWLAGYSQATLWLLGSDDWEQDAGRGDRLRLAA